MTWRCYVLLLVHTHCCVFSANDAVLFNDIRNLVGSQGNEPVDQTDLPDAAAVIGTVFSYSLPDGLCHDTSKLKVMEAGSDGTLPNWLYIDDHMLLGVPTALDSGVLYIQAMCSQPSEHITKNEDEVPDKSDIFVITVGFSEPQLRTLKSDSTNSNSSMSPGLKCQPYEEVFKSNLILDSNIHHMNATQRVDVLHKMSTFLSLDMFSLSLMPSLSSVLGRLLKTSILSAGPGNVKKPSPNPGVSVSWTVGCGPFKQIRDLEQILQMNIHSNRITKHIGHDILGWQITKDQAKLKMSKSQRRKRQILATVVPTSTITNVPTRVTDASTFTISEESSDTLETSSIFLSSSILSSSSSQVFDTVLTPSPSEISMKSSESPSTSELASETSSPMATVSNSTTFSSVSTVTSSSFSSPVMTSIVESSPDISQFSSMFSENASSEVVSPSSTGEIMPSTTVESFVMSKTSILNETVVLSSSVVVTSEFMSTSNLTSEPSISSSINITSELTSKPISSSEPFSSIASEFSSVTDSSLFETLSLSSMQILLNSSMLNSTPIIESVSTAPPVISSMLNSTPIIESVSTAPPVISSMLNSTSIIESVSTAPPVISSSVTPETSNLTTELYTPTPSISTSTVVSTPVVESTSSTVTAPLSSSTLLNNTSQELSSSLAPSVTSSMSPSLNSSSSVQQTSMSYVPTSQVSGSQTPSQLDSSSVLNESISTTIESSTFSLSLMSSSPTTSPTVAVKSSVMSSVINSSSLLLSSSDFTSVISTSVIESSSGFFLSSSDIAFPTSSLMQTPESSATTLVTSVTLSDSSSFISSSMSLPVSTFNLSSSAPSTLSSSFTTSSSLSSSSQPLVSPSWIVSSVALDTTTVMSSSLSDSSTISSPMESSTSATVSSSPFVTLMVSSSSTLASSTMVSSSLFVTSVVSSSSVEVSSFRVPSSSQASFEVTSSLVSSSSSSVILLSSQMSSSVSPTTSSTVVPSSSVILTTTEPANLHPTLYNPIDVIRIVIGEYFQLEVPVDTFHDPEEGTAEKLRLELLTMNFDSITSSSWIQFNASSRLIYGLPVSSDFMSVSADTPITFVLKATDSDGAFAVDVLQVIIQTPSSGPSHQITVRVDVDYPAFMLVRDNAIDLIGKIGEYYGDSGPRFIGVSAIDRGSVVLSWSNTTLSRTTCPANLIQLLYHKLTYPNDTVKSGFVSALSPYKVLSAWFQYQGACVPVVTTTTTPVETASIGRVVVDEYEKYIISVIPAVGLAAVALIIALVLFFLYKRRRTGQKLVAKVDKPVYTKNRKPTILPEELEMDDVQVPKKIRPRGPVILETDLNYEDDKKPSYDSRPPPPRYNLPHSGGYADLFDQIDADSLSPPPSYRSEAPARPPPLYRLPPAYLENPSESEV